MNKKVVIGIVVVVMVVLVWWMLAAKKAAAPTGEVAVTETPTEYDQALSGLDEANIDAEFQGIDADLQKL